MSDRHRDAVIKVATVLDDAKTRDVVALDVQASCGFADFFVIATVNSQGHLRGLIVTLDELFEEIGVEPLHPRRRDSEIGWVLIDLGFAVIHLMTEEMRSFYELERLWFAADVIYSSSSQSSDSSASSSRSSSNPSSKSSP